MPTLVFGQTPGADVTAGHKDTFLMGPANQSFAGDAIMGISSIASALVQFNLAAIPADAIVTAAVLSLKCDSPPMVGNVDITINPMLTHWGVDDTTEGASENPATGGQATYVNAMSALVPTTWIGGNFSANDYGAAEDTITVVAGEAAGTAHTADIPVMVQDWVTTPANNAGLALITDALMACTLGTQQHATQARRPSLTVTYTVPGPVPPPGPAPAPTPTGPNWMTAKGVRPSKTGLAVANGIGV